MRSSPAAPTHVDEGCLRTDDRYDHRSTVEGPEARSQSNARPASGPGLVWKTQETIQAEH
jgi:hypothetical protein